MPIEEAREAEAVFREDAMDPRLIVTDVDVDLEAVLLSVKGHDTTRTVVVDVKTDSALADEKLDNEVVMLNLEADEELSAPSLHGGDGRE